MVELQYVNKKYDSGAVALKNVSLTIEKGEIFALLGPNGAGKTTLISIICGLVNASSGVIRVGGYDIVSDFRAARKQIGLVPQELTADAFETVWSTVCYSRGLFGFPPDGAYIEKILKDLSLWEKRRSPLMTLSGGMKRRVLIAKALSHEPQVLFLDEPTAGVDVELRKSLWNMIADLKQRNITIILTTHYIEEAEKLADRVGVIHCGELVLVEEKEALIRKLGRKELVIYLKSPLEVLPDELGFESLELSASGEQLVYTYDRSKQDNGIPELLDKLQRNGIRCHDLNTKQSSLEDIFVSLVNKR